MWIAFGCGVVIGIMLAVWIAVFLGMADFYKGRPDLLIAREGKQAA